MYCTYYKYLDYAVSVHSIVSAGPLATNRAPKCVAAPSHSLNGGAAKSAAACAIGASVSAAPRASGGGRLHAGVTDIDQMLQVRLASVFPSTVTRGF